MRISRDLTLLLLASLCGGLAGAAASFFVTPLLVPLSRPMRVATSTEPVLSLIPVERRVETVVIPPSFLKRRASALASLYRKPKGITLEERLLGPERLLGRAVALTSDGWFVTTAGALDRLRLAEITIVHNGSSYSIERGFLDRLNGAIYLKTAASGLTASAFARAEEATEGQEIWIESHPDGFSPQVIVDAGARISSNDSVSSEIASRRLVANRVTGKGERGGAAWNSSGSLVGLIESKEGEELRLIFAGTLASSLASLLEHGEIRHALLGVRAVDLATLQLDGQRNGLPMRGAWLRDDKRSGKSAGGIAQLRAGDVILRVERDILDGRADLGEILSEFKPGSSITLRVLRDGKDLDVSVKLGTFVTSEKLK